MKNIKLFLSIVFFSVGTSVFAQEASTASSGFFANNMIAIVIGLVLLIALFALYKLLNSMIRMKEVEIYDKHGVDAYKAHSGEGKWGGLTGAVPVEQNKDILLDHNYDGIMELDNKLPPWWVWLFNITIAIAFIYYPYYHLMGNDWSSANEWKSEMAAAKVKVDAYKGSQTDLVSIDNVSRLTDAADLTKGKEIWTKNCVACHGVEGQGGIGPNMTDNYWIHGCDIKDLYKVIRDGVPAKGMISWKSQLKPAQMQEVASYIFTLSGTNPANGKAKEGNECKI